MSKRQFFQKTASREMHQKPDFWKKLVVGLLAEPRTFIASKLDKPLKSPLRHERPGIVSLLAATPNFFTIFFPKPFFYEKQSSDFRSLAASQPRSLAASQPRSLAASQPRSLAASQLSSSCCC
jgi:hypothetical protein